MTRSERLVAEGSVSAIEVTGVSDIKTEPSALDSVIFNGKGIRIVDPEHELKFTPLQKFWGRIKHSSLIGEPLRDLKGYLVRRF